MTLTELKCKNAKSREKAYKIFDGGGLYLEIMPSGAKYWRLKYRSAGKEKRLAIGVYPTVSLAKARDACIDPKRDIRKGGDPSASRQETKRLDRLNAQNTFKAIALEWHTHNYSTWSERHAKHILLRLENDVFPELGEVPIRTITPVHVVACIRKIEGRGAGEMARRAKQMCSQVFRYAVVTGRADRDVTGSLKDALKKRKVKHYGAIEVDDLPKLLAALKENDARISRQTKLAMNLTMLTFVRTSELIEATWSEIDLEKREWLIPAERMKMRQPHIVPLSEQVVEIFNELKTLNPKREHVFPSIPRPHKPMSNATILRALERMGYKHKMTGHGFRALALSAIKEKLSYTHEIVDRQLAHTPKSRVDKAYDRAKFLPQRRKMMQDWADYVDSIR